MNQSRFLIIVAALLFLTFGPQSTTVRAQGTLLPPGAPAPTMKSLDQVEARAAITNTGAVTISQPGSYYLTHNISVITGDAITISTNEVTLDLNGFTVSSTAASANGTGILLNNGRTNIAIRNGFIRGTVTTNNSGVYVGGGFANGIYYSGTSPYNVSVSDVSVSGCLVYGMHLGVNSTVAKSCTAKTVGSYGIVAFSVSDCNAVDCGVYGIACGTAINCYGAATGSGIGMNATAAHNCFGSSVNNDGIDGVLATGCYGLSVTGTGLYFNIAENCFGTSTSGTGLLATAASNCYGQSASGKGLNSTVANGCFGNSSSSTGLTATIAGNSSGGGVPALSVGHGLNSF